MNKTHRYRSKGGLLTPFGRFFFSDGKKSGIIAVNCGCGTGGKPKGPVGAPQGLGGAAAPAAGRRKDEDMEKVLVCITAQSNSRRLIDEGAGLCEASGGELHILHVQKGHNIFENEDTPRLLSELFEYGSTRGGMIHAICSEDVPESIGRFIADTHITRLVLGAPPEGLPERLRREGSQLAQIVGRLPRPVEVTVVGRED